MVKIHIALVGETTENIVNGIVRLGADELYPIVSEKYKETSIQDLHDKLPMVKIQNEINERNLIVDPFQNDAFVTEVPDKKV